MLLIGFNIDLQILTSIVDFHKETHTYAFELVKSSRTMTVDSAEKQPHIQAIRITYQQQALKLRTNKKFS